MVFGGLTPTQLAEKYGLTKAWVSCIINSPLFRAEAERLSESVEATDKQIGSELKQLALRANEIIAETLYDAKPSKSRLDAAFKILDRTGYHPKTEKIDMVDKRKLTIINLAPLPGDDPETSHQRVLEIAQQLKEGEEE